MLSPNKCPPEATIAKGKPAHPALLALLCSAALVLGAWPWVGASIVSFVSDPPPHPLPAWQCNAQDGSVTQDGVIVDASGVAWEAGIDYHAQSALRSTPKETYQWNIELVEAGHLEMIWLYVLHGGSAVLRPPRGGAARCVPAAVAASAPGFHLALAAAALAVAGATAAVAQPATAAAVAQPATAVSVATTTVAATVALPAAAAAQPATAVSVAAAAAALPAAAVAQPATAVSVAAVYVAITTTTVAITATTVSAVATA
eukprot:scaffold33302_cov34-Phaeocystis_antarctica.AAC.1